MSESNKVSTGNNWNQGDVIKMEKVRTLLCDIYTKSGETDENKPLATLITNAICASLLLRVQLEDETKKYREYMLNWMEENTND